MDALQVLRFCDGVKKVLVVEPLRCVTDCAVDEMYTHRNVVPPLNKTLLLTK